MGIEIEDFTGLNQEEIKNKIGQIELFFPQEIELEVEKIINDVKKRGDEALIEYVRQFDGVDISKKGIIVEPGDIEKGSKGFPDLFVEALDRSIERIRKYHEYSTPEDWFFVDELGNSLGLRSTPIERVGIYIPGGKASYPSSLLMTCIPAMVAGVREIAVLSPPASFDEPSSLALALKRLGGIGEIYRVGGVQGIAALAFGTDTIKKVDKIVGPGNIYVTLAKKRLYGYVDIDMVCGPSEVLIISDGSVDPRLTAIDLLAQAEHDELARPLCVTTSMDNAIEVRDWVLRLTEESERREIIEKSLQMRGKIYVVKGEDEACVLTNAIAPEHLEIQTKKPGSLLKKIKNAGAIFLGSFSAEAFGDYIAGPSHVLPTGGTARFFSPLNVLSFVKFSSVVDMSKNGVERLGKYAACFARVEGLTSHALSVEFRGGKG